MDSLLDLNGPDSMVPFIYRDPMKMIPVPSDLAARYSDERPASRSQARPAVADMTDQEMETWREWNRQAKDDASVAHFVLNELPELKAKARRAVNNRDFDAGQAIVDRVAEVVDTRADFLAQWANLPEGGAAAQRVSADVQQVVTGDFKDAWGLSNLLNTESEEAKSERAKSASKDLDVSEDVARATFDRDHEKHPVYRMFGPILAARGLPQSSEMTAQQVKDQQTAYLKSVVRLDQKYGSQFGSPSDLGEFVAAFNANMNGKGVTAGESVLMSAAETFLNQHDYSAHEFMQRYADSVKALMGPGAGMPDDQGKSKEQTIRGRMDVHEAQALMSAFTREAARLGVQDDVTSGKYRDALAASALVSRRLHELYGIDLRDGVRGGTSSSIARMALSKLGVPGADDGVLPRIDEVTSRLSLLMSEPTRQLVQLKQGQKGDIAGSLVDGQNPYLQTEMAMVRKAGPALWKAMSAGGDMQPVIDAMASALTPRLGADLAKNVAGDLVGNLTGNEGGPRMTIEESLRRRGLIPKAEAPEDVPADKRLSYGDNFNSNDIGLLAKGEVVSTERGNENLRRAQKEMAIQIQRREQDAGQKEKGLYSPDYCKAAGRLYANLTGDWSDELVTSGLLIDLSIKGRTARGSGQSFAAKDDNERSMVYDNARLLLAKLRNENLPREVRAEAAAKLLIIGASGAPLYETRSESGGLGSTYSRPVRHLWPSIREALAAVGYGVPDDQRDFEARGFDLRALAKVMPELLESNLVKSGFLELEGRAGSGFSVKNMLRKGQVEAVSDPKKNDGRDDPTLSEEQLAARRALATFETEATATGSALARYQKHLAAEGMDGDGMQVATAAAARSFADAYRNGGVAEVERTLQAWMGRRRYYLPHMSATSGPDKTTTYSIDPHQVDVTPQLTPAEWESVRRMKVDEYRALTNQDLPDGVLETLQVTGPATYRDMIALKKAFALTQARSAGTTSGKESGEQPQ